MAKGALAHAGPVCDSIGPRVTKTAIALFAYVYPSGLALSKASWGDLIHFLSLTRNCCQTTSWSFLGMEHFADRDLNM